ncbi:Rrf2 family transcriptional regulator [Gluconobacter sphaericus]|nr:Rrf2 family transcriptional regulator [Gluconobacter sphaericus]MBF0886678.1 Rrf2 family transcriptional regulator [Gluconobacter sphaericus]
MRQDNRLSCVLHVLLHMAEAGGPMTSEVLARALNTNPVVVRRLMGGLREHGYVHSEKGHGGGWTLSCQLDQVTLRDIYEALDAPRLFAIGNRSEETECLVEEVVNHAMSSVLTDVKAQFLARFGQITLAALHADFHQKLAERFSGGLT